MHDPDNRTSGWSAAVHPLRTLPLWVKITKIAVLSVILAGSVGFVWVMSSLPRVDGRIPAQGLLLPATVIRDSLGIPTISARSPHDAYFALGWVHAQDRLWQMEIQRRAAGGRLAEIAGPAALKSDMFMRTLGLTAAAEDNLAAVDEATREALQAYADGVNAWIGGNRHRLPLEFQVSRTRPDDWSPRDSVLIGRLLALQLGGDWRSELTAAKLAQRLPPRRLKELLSGLEVADATPSAPPGIDAVLPETAHPRLASNAWAVAGFHTASGKPLLANDPHLDLTRIGGWYLAAIDATAIKAFGATLPGIPFHLIGHNRVIAWGTTTTSADTVDLFIEKTVGNDQYQTPQGPRPFASRQEVIDVRGQERVVMTVRETRHGPVISDLFPGGSVEPGTVIAFQSTALMQKDLTAQALYHLNRALDWNGAQAALRDFHSPVQNFIIAGGDGAIGMISAGRIPIRKGGDGSKPGQGWTAANDWTGTIPFEKLPVQSNPKSGWLINANNKVAPDRYPFLITRYWPADDRAERIRMWLDAHPRNLSVEDMRALQGDTVSLPALELKEMLTGQDWPDDRLRQAADLIEHWDGRMDRDRPEPLIYSAWIDELWQGVVSDDLGEDFPAWRAVRPHVLMTLLTKYPAWCDDQKTAELETCEDQSAAALRRTLEGLSRRFGGDMNGWRWGDAHRLVLENTALNAIPFLSRAADLRTPSDGDDSTINRGTYLPGDFRHVHGPGLRAVFDLADLGRSTFVIPGGQSINVLSRHYDDFLPLWRDNSAVPVGTNAALESRHLPVMALEPAK